MRPTHLTALLAALSLLALSACSKQTAPAPAPKAKAEAKAPATPAKTEAAKEAPEKKSPTEPQAEKATAPAGSIDTKTTVAKDKAGDTGASDAEKAKLALVYKEIYCAQRRGESEKLLEIYTKNGFDDPETWTKTWTKAAEDGAWVAKITHDAIRECGDAEPTSP